MLLAIEGLEHRYGAVTALSNFTMHLNRRDIVGLLGPNGSGKSTLLRVLSTVMQPQAGKVEICGFDVVKNVEAVRSRIGVVFQTQTLDKLLTVEENLMACGSFYGMYGRALVERARAVMGQLGISDKRGERVKNLSGGMQRRAELGRALLHEPQLLLLDEPTTGLDPMAREEFWRAIVELRDRRNTAILLSTHLFEEAARCESLILLDRGVSVAAGTPEELKAGIGGEVIELHARRPEEALEVLRAHFDQAMELSDGVIRVVATEAHKLIPRLVDALPGEVVSIGLHQPTLADVFRKAVQA